MKCRIKFCVYGLILINILISGALILSLVFFKKIARIHQDVSQNFNVDHNVVTSINKEIGRMEGAHAVFYPLTNGYEIFIVYPWYKSHLPENIRERVERILAE